MSDGVMGATPFHGERIRKPIPDTVLAFGLMAAVVVVWEIVIRLLNVPTFVLPAPTAVVHVVQPRFDPPQTTNVSTLAWPPSGLARNEVMVSIARTALLVIGNRNGQRVSPLRMNLSQV